MKLKKILILPILTIIIAINLSGFAYSAPKELIEKIYAVVNGELITYSELKLAENEMSRVLRQQYQDNEELLKQNLDEMKKNLLDRLIEQKLILSVAKERNYDVEPEIEIILKDIKKQNNIGSDEELKQAIEAQGMDYAKWLQQLKETSMQHRLIREDIGYKIKIDNSQIMEYYRQHMQDYTKPMEFSINCIYLDKSQVLNEATLTEKRQAIDSELQSGSFVEVAKKYSQLPSTENNYYLGHFKAGELNAKIEEAAKKLEVNQFSSWLETDTGWYIIQLLERKDPELMEYKTVRSEIEETLMTQEQNIKLKDYVEQLKKDSHIKILEEYK
jgi:parvulin-like peptidyl-prolyl isomerase